MGSTHRRRYRPALEWVSAALACVLSLGPASGSLPIFENNTPAGFSQPDSTAKQDFVEGDEVTVRVDLNQAATPTYPVIGHFHNVERAETLDTDDVDGSRVDLAVSDNGIIHAAWIARETKASMSTPVYFVRYARSNNNGASFTEAVSISGSLRFDLLTADGGGGSFSTLDLEVDSRGNPRVAYAFNHRPDGKTAQYSSDADNVYLNYSETGGASWLPGNKAIVVNDTTTVGEGRTTAFPRLAIDERDNIFISYTRGASRGGGAGTDDIMLARVNRETSPFTMKAVGSVGTVGSAGGVRLTPNADRQTGPDLAVGRGDVLHVVYFHEDAASPAMEHKTLLADDWDDVGSFGWEQDLDGAAVDDFDPDPTANAALNAAASFVFPTVVVDTVRSPDRIYALYKYGDATYETVFFNSYTYDHRSGNGAGWSAAQAQAVWSTAPSPVFRSGNLAYNIEQDWTVVDRVSAVVDDRRNDRGELHIAFSAGYSNTTDGVVGEQDIYHGFYNGVTWTLPEKVADDDAGTADGVLGTDRFLHAPVLATRANNDNVYLAFIGGLAEGHGVQGVTDVDNHPYFKVLGRAVSWEDESRPVGGYQYDLSYTPVNPHNATADIDSNAVWVHVADNLTGEGLGATGKQGDGFLAGNWENVGTSLQDNDKFFEGRRDEDGSSDNEWGDDDDKVGLLVKLNVLGSDSSTNLQVITSSTASSGGTGQGERTVRVDQEPPVSLAIDDFFLLGAKIDIVDANTAPTIRLLQPDGFVDSANTSFPIRYTLTDPDDDFGGDLLAALYFAESGGLSTVQDVRIFGTLIADENDNTAVNSGGTDDFKEGKNQVYSWDDPPTALKNLFYASILQAPSSDYYIYLVAEDGKNPPAFVRSPGAVAVRHKPLVLQLDPTVRDTVDTGVRTGFTANPYDLDFAIRDYDNQGSSQVALYYSAFSGLTSVSVSGTYPSQAFALGKSVSGVRAQYIENSDTLTSADREFRWDVTDSVFVGPDSAAVAAGQYHLYTVVSDSTHIVVAQSNGQLVIRHSPSFTFYEPPRDTHRRINSGSQPVYSIQWQKGRGDADFDDDATIDLYYTTDNPADINYEEFPDSLLKDSDTQTIVTNLSEDGDGAADMYVWNFRDSTGDIPTAGTKVWLYALIGDEDGNEDEVLGGALTVYHTPYINLTSSDLDDLTSFNKNDVLRVSWEDYLVDDGQSTDDAYIRLYASESPSNFVTVEDVDTAVDGTTTFLLNSSDGTKSGVIETLRESGNEFFDWNTKLFGNASTDYDIYAAISADYSFDNNDVGGIQLSSSSSPLTIGVGGATPTVSLSPTDLAIAIGDTVTFDVMVQHSEPINLVQVILQINDDDFQIIDEDPDAAADQPFVDLGNVFAGTDPIENQFVAGSPNQLRFAKSSFTGQLVGTTTEPEALARLRLIAREDMGPTPSLAFATGSNGTVLGLVGDSDPLDTGGGLTAPPPELTRQARGQIAAIVELEGRAAPLGTGDHTTLLDVHLRVPGSIIDIDDDNYTRANDEIGALDTVEVTTAADGALTLVSVPAGRYVLTVKDTSHVSGRTDTIIVRNGETVTISSGLRNGFFGSDLRGDPTALLPSSGKELIAGDVSQDNEINEDDVNLIIAAWGVDDLAPSFEQADINNDDEVGAADLTVTTSNFGNSEGFGAPPVYRRARKADVADGQTKLELRPMVQRRARAVAPGEVLGIEVHGVDLDDLAGYEFRIDLDETRLRPLLERAEAGDVFQENPYGSFFDVRLEDGSLHVLSSRVGKTWSATGEGAMAILWFEVLDDGAEVALELGEGVLLNTAYEPEPVSWGNSLLDLLLPQEPLLDVNYPNPFNPSTAIPFALPAGQEVDLDIYNMLGQRVRTLMTGYLDPGFHTIVWNGRDDAGRSVAAGLYISQLRADGFRQTRKMTLLK